VKTPLKWTLIATTIVVLVTISYYTSSIVSFLARSSKDWQFVQSVGGIALGKPQRDNHGHVLLPIRCDVSGLQTITVRPKGLNSALVCEPPLVRIQSGTIFLTIRTSVAIASGNTDPRCPTADLGTLSAGDYSVIYRSPDGSEQPLGSINIP
jgi:hypothetical protein